MAISKDLPATLKAIQVRNYRSLRHVDLRFDGNFHVLVGPNGSGKSALLDAIAFLSDYIDLGPELAVKKRTRNFQDLIWGRPAQESGFELAAEFTVGDHELRFELQVEEFGGGVRVAVENGYLGHLKPDEFAESAGSNSICGSDQAAGRKQRQAFGRRKEISNMGNVMNVLWFSPDNADNRKLLFECDHRDDDRSAIGLLSGLSDVNSLDDEENWDFSNLEQIGDALTRRGVQRLQLDSRKLRQA